MLYFQNETSYWFKMFNSLLSQTNNATKKTPSLFVRLKRLRRMFYLVKGKIQRYWYIIQKKTMDFWISLGVTEHFKVQHVVSAFWAKWWWSLYYYKTFVGCYLIFWKPKLVKRILFENELSAKLQSLYYFDRGIP